MTELVRLLLSPAAAAVLLALAAMRATVPVDSFAPLARHSSSADPRDELQLRFHLQQHRHQHRHRHRHQHQHTLLFAESPKYQKRDGFLKRSECVGRGSYLLHIDCADDGNDDGNGDACEYEPGHVLALEIRPPTKVESSGDEDSRMTPTMNEKTQKDTIANDGWMRGPYTVSRGYGSNTRKDAEGFQVLIKEVGFKSHVFATCPEGTPVRFGGRFKVPIAQGILDAAGASASVSADASVSEDRDATQRVVMVATGVGVGPCVGASELLLAAARAEADADAESDASGNGSDHDNHEIRAIDVLASYRTTEEIAMESDLEALRESSSNSNSSSSETMAFRWKSIVTGTDGRLSASGPEVLANRYLRPGAEFDLDSVSATRGTHYHIIGNGQLVNEWKEGLERAGVPADRVTVEAYFNHAAEADPSAVDTICEAIRLLDSKSESSSNSSVSNSNEPMVVDVDVAETSAVA
mmetsp:Transcript_29785/g.70135  ORF Transcript_29785/g.70135 Transcript_29785/m.70135 type:complete len:468 (-) Transcript_29785:1806-3209(-)